MKKIDNQKIDFYFINYFIFLFFTGGCNFTPYKKKIEQEVANQSLHWMARKKFQIEAVQN